MPQSHSIPTSATAASSASSGAVTPGRREACSGWLTATRGGEGGQTQGDFVDKQQRRRWEEGVSPFAPPPLSLGERLKLILWSDLRLFSPSVSRLGAMHSRYEAEINGVEEGAGEDEDWDLLSVI
ncbi:hypothetical protein PG987_000352 [Apiospora arundinis]